MCHSMSDYLLSNVPAGVSTPASLLWTHSEQYYLSSTIMQHNTDQQRCWAVSKTFAVSWQPVFVVMHQLVSEYLKWTVTLCHCTLVAFEHLLVITSGMYWSVAQVVSFLEALGRRGQGPLQRKRCWLTSFTHNFFSQDFISKAVQRLEGTFIQCGGPLYTAGHTREVRTTVTGKLLLLWFHAAAALPSFSGL